MKAAGNGHLDAVKFLESKGADIYNRVIHAVAYKGHMEILVYLMKKGASVHTPDKARLIHAYLTCVTLLRKAGLLSTMRPSEVTTTL